jgi:FlaG/FlaF family flagellin (archaellin)
MHYSKRKIERKGEDAVSPVVGVMLMLVVTIIIAAVVSAFAGGLTNPSQKAPSASVEIHVLNGGDSNTSYFTMKVLGVNSPIPTKSLKIVTSWTTTNRTSGLTITGGNTTYAGLANVYIPGELSAYTGTNITVPTGYGNGVNAWANNTYHPQNAQWGNFVLASGTVTMDEPTTDYGLVGGATTNYQYAGTHTYIDPMQAILGGQWYNLQNGNLVNVRIIDTISGKEIVDQQVVVGA